MEIAVKRAIAYSLATLVTGGLAYGGFLYEPDPDVGTLLGSIDLQVRLAYGIPAFGKDGGKHPHYDTKLEAIGHISRHEAFHAGQLATLRRLLGKSFLR